MRGMLGVVPEILAVEQLQLVGDQGIIALPQDRSERLVSLERELPFLPHVIRRDGPGTDHQHQPRAAIASRIYW